MLKIARNRWMALLAAAVGVCLLGASNAGAVVLRTASGKSVGVIPRAGVTLPPSASGSASAAVPRRFAMNGNMDYHGGGVLHTSSPYLIFWDPGNGISASSRALMTRYFSDVAADGGSSGNVYGVLRQYTDASGFADYRQAFSPPSQVIVDTQPFSSDCGTTGASDPVCVTDGQLEGELNRLISSRGLPSGSGPNAPIYFVVTPPQVNVCAAANQCSSNFFCAYHSGFSNSSTNVLYGVIPMLGTTLDPKACQADGTGVLQRPNGDNADIAISYLSHEDSETITDPNFDGWYDSTGSNQNEVGDSCAATGAIDPNGGFNPSAFAPALGANGALYDQVIGGHPYYVQSEWSNGAATCQLRPAPGAPSSSFTISTSSVAPGVPVTFDPSASSSSQGYSSVTWNFGDGSAPEFSSYPAAPTGVSHAFPRPGNFTVSLTLVDTAGNISTTGHQVTAGTLPTASLIATTAGPVAGAAVGFSGRASTDPNGGSIASYLWSFGDGSTATGSSPSHVYAAPGTYRVTLYVADNFGLVSAPTSRTVSVDEPPSARMQMNTTHPAAGVAISFTARSSSDPDGGIRSSSWSFGDGASGSGVAPRHTFKRSGTYTLRLTITDSDGHSTTSASRISVAVAGKITGLSVQSHGGARLLVVHVTGPGRLTIGRKTVKVSKAGTIKIKLVLPASSVRVLASAHAVKLTIVIKFVPVAGVSTTRKASFTLRS